MKRSYEAPKLINHGTVSNLTAASSESAPSDFVFGEQGEVIGTITGTLDACSFGDMRQCIAPAPGN